MSARWVFGCVVTVLSVLQAGCSDGPKRIYAPSINAKMAGLQAIEMYDAENDGNIRRDELEKCPALKSALAQIDTMGEGAITAEQITKRIREWQRSRRGRISFTCTVQRNGRPLADAEVKLVPEKFLGENMIVATGKSNMHGVASLSVPTIGRGDPAGVPPGLYRVEITKGSEIPAKYNTDTTFGIEVAADMLKSRESIEFDMKY